jgi:hypothetical protein
MPEPPDAARASLVALLGQLRDTQRELHETEERLLELDSRYRELTEVSVPAAMASCGTLDYTLTDGTRTALKEAYRCGQLDAAERPEGASWVDAKGHGDLFRNTLTVAFNREDDALATEIEELIRRHPAGNRLLIDRRRVILWNTLSSFVKEQIAQGEDVPLQDLGVVRQTFADVTRAGAARFKRIWQKR